MQTTVDSAIPWTHRLAAALVGIVAAASMSGVSADVARPVAEPQPLAAGDGHGQLKGTVWIVNRDRGELAIFDAETGDVLTTLPVGAGAHDICISERAGKAYIAAETINRVTTVDIETLALASIDVGPLPHHVEPSHDGRTIYVSLASHSPAVGAPQVAAIDIETNAVSYITTSHNPLARSHGPLPSLDGETLYVAHDTGDELSGVDTETGEISTSVSPILRAEEAIATRFGDVLWVSSRGDGTVKRVDLASTTITGSVAVGVQPESVMLTPNEHTLVVSMRGTPAALAFVDTVNLTLRGTVPIAGAGTFGDLAVITSDGRYVFATFDAGAAGTGGVAVVDAHNGTVVARWPYPGTGRPHGVWYLKTKARF